MSDPTLVMLDEPMAGVNPALTQSLLDHILDLKDRGMTVLFVEHDMHMVRHIADWVVVMAEGRVVAEGRPQTVMQDQAVIDAYLGAHQDVDLGIVTGRSRASSTPRRCSKIKEERTRWPSEAENRCVPTPNDGEPRSGDPRADASSWRSATSSPGYLPGINILNGARPHRAPG